MAALGQQFSTFLVAGSLYSKHWEPQRAFVQVGISTDIYHTWKLRLRNLKIVIVFNMINPLHVNTFRGENLFFKQNAVRVTFYIFASLKCVA